MSRNGSEATSSAPVRSAARSRVQSIGPPTVSVPSEAPVWMPFGSMIRPVAVSVVRRSNGSSGVRAAKYGSFGSSSVQ